MAGSASQNKELVILLTKVLLTEYFVESYKAPNDFLCKWKEETDAPIMDEELLKSQINFFEKNLIGDNDKNVGIIDSLPAFKRFSNYQQKEKIYEKFVKEDKKNSELDINIQEYFLVNLMWNKTEQAGINIIENFKKSNIPFLPMILMICKETLLFHNIKNYTDSFEENLKDLLLI